MNLLLERKGTVVSLLSSLKQGGEGSVHPIIGEPGLVAKLFREPTAERVEKLRAMLDNPPVVAGNAPVLIAWPVDRLLNRHRECVGYVMPYAKGMEPLFSFYHPGSRPRGVDYPFLLRVAKNVALAVSAFHRHGYVLGDINESNILVGPDASVAVVDTDSLQVRTQLKVFHCLVGKPDYTPPEILQTGKDFGDIDRHAHHDAFGLGVLIFQLLMDGNHPFAAHHEGPGGREPLTDRMKQGFWPYSERRRGAYRPRREAPPIESLSPRLQELMRDCFDSGHVNPVSRPTADDWYQALSDAEEEWKKPGAKLRYFWYRTLDRRAWGQKVAAGYEQIKGWVPPLPRKAWIAIACAVAVGLLILASLLWPSSTEVQASQGDETPTLWRDVQKRRPQATPTATSKQRTDVYETPELWKQLQKRNRK